MIRITSVTMTDNELLAYVGSKFDNDAQVTISIDPKDTFEVLHEMNKITLTVKDVDVSFIECPAGTFMMGSPEEEPGRLINEFYHEVTIEEPFLLAETLCTQELWEAVMGSNPSYFIGPQLPVERVSYYTIVNDFLPALNTLLAEQGYEAVLPTEEQWEYACRAGTTTAYYCGDTITDKDANFDGNVGQTTPCKAYLPNPWGFYDMHGNLWQWTASE